MDEQSVVTYLVSLNKAVGEDVPELDAEIIAHTAAHSTATGKGSIVSTPKTGRTDHG